MAHKVASVQLLHDDSVSLYNDVVQGDNEYSAARIIRDLDDGIANFKENWKGKDAGAQINNIVGVRNAMVEVSNALGILSSESSKVASNYRDIQNSNGAGLDQLNAVNAETKTLIEEYSDDRDTIDINDMVAAGQQKINAAKDELEQFFAKVEDIAGRIMENWQDGDDARVNAEAAIANFKEKFGQYKETLASASRSVDTAIENYKM